MASPSRFPEHLLSDTPSARLSYFKAFTSEHPFLVAATHEVMRAIREPTGALLVYVFGQTGVGKTTLKRRVEKQLLEEALPELENDRGRIPFASMDVVALDPGSFSPRDYYTRALLALDEPLIGHTLKRPLPNRADQADESLRPRGGPVMDLRLRLEQAIRHRRPSAFILDEAQHLMKTASGRRLQDQLDWIKSLATMTGTVHVLLGTYELLIRDLSAQLSRRARDIHFPRYRLDRKSDVEAFQNVLWKFERHLPLEKQASLLEHWEFCYQRTRGCVGILKDLLTQALADALHDGRPTVDYDLLQRHALSRSQYDKIENDTAHHEKELGYAAFSTNIQDHGSTRRDVVASKENAEDAAEEMSMRAVERKPPRRVGQRKARRDPVGEHQHAS